MVNEQVEDDARKEEDSVSEDLRDPRLGRPDMDELRVLPRLSA